MKLQEFIRVSGHEWELARRLENARADLIGAESEREAGFVTDARNRVLRCELDLYEHKMSEGRRFQCA